MIAGPPVFAKGLVLASTGYRTVELWAIRPDGSAATISPRRSMMATGFIL